MKTLLFLILALVAVLVAMPIHADQLTIASASVFSADSLPFIGVAGLLVNKATLDNIFTGLKTLFNGALKAGAGDWQMTGMEVPSTGEGEDYAWLSRFPRMRKWIGDKFVKALEAGKYYVKNDDYETTIAVKRNHIEDDKLGIYSSQATAAGESSAELNDIISDDLKNNAFAKTGIDGQYFYDTDHEVGDASVSNKLTIALSAATKAAALASYGAARAMVMNFKDDEGAPLRLVPDTLEVPPALEAVARTLCEQEKLDDGSTNPYRGTAKVLVNPGLTSSTQWMLHVTSKSVKPFIIQMRKAPVFVQQTGMDNDDVFNKGEFKFGAEARAAGVYGFWQLSVGSDGTT